MVQFEKPLSDENMFRRFRLQCGTCGNPLSIREIERQEDDIRIQVDACPHCLRDAENRTDFSIEQVPEIQELIDFVLKEKRVIFGKPLEKLTQAEMMATIGYLLKYPKSRL